MDVIKKGSRKERAVILLQALLSEADLLETIDGVFGPGTDRAVKAFQAQNGLVVDGIVGQKTWTTLFALFPGLLQRLKAKYLQEEDMVHAARDLGVELAAIKAVNEVESAGPGFIVEEPVILFEGHVFWKELARKGIDPALHRHGNEHILYPKWTTSHYSGGRGEYRRLEAAKKIDEEAALRSASWGIFQVMGFNAEELGYRDVFDFVDSMFRHEREHLKAFCAYIRTHDLVHALQVKDWRAFAKGYNGPLYEKNRYHTRLARAYERYT
ncbi:MAG: N-acetylmuramidase family protein [Prosthecochloris sp.]|nr:N-acetylmuramidase family protein [Prosthecochloris sp.]